MRAKPISALQETFFVNYPLLWQAKSFSSEYCVVDYKYINDLEKQSGFCIAAAAQFCAATVRFCAAACGRVNQ